MHNRGFYSQSFSVVTVLAVFLTSAGDQHLLQPGPSNLTGVQLSSEWLALGKAAVDFVDRETPSRALPYTPSRFTRSTTRYVIAHYFPPFPISIDGESPAHDYYAINYLRADGEGGKHRAAGGYLRARPLPVAVPTGLNYRKFHLAIDVARAARIGVDAFGVDLLTIDPTNALWQTSVDMLDAARAASPGFRIVPEPDMGSLGEETTPEQLAQALTAFAQHPASLRTSDGRMIVMPVAAEKRSASWWSELRHKMDGRGFPIALIPVFIDRTSLPSFAPIAAGASVWGDRYATASTANLQSARASHAAGISSWIMPVAFQDYRPHSHVLNETRNSDGWRAQWQSALSTKCSGVHLITWNDYSENTQIAPSIPGGFGIYDLTGYYIAWYKRGSPAPLTQDGAYLVHRNQVLALSAGAGAPLNVVGPTRLSNDVEAVVLLKKPAMVKLQVGSLSRQLSARAGLSTLRLRAAPGALTLVISRPGEATLSFRAASRISNRPVVQDATYRVESLTRPAEQQ